MRKFVSLLFLAFLFYGQVFAQAPATARIHHTAYDSGGAVVSGYTVTIVRAIKNGLTLSGFPKTCRTNSSGVLLDSDGSTQGCSVIQGAAVWISTNGSPFNANGSAGVSVTIGTYSNGATTNAAGYSIGATTITLASAGTGAIAAGDVITFAGDTNRYTVATGDADVSNGGTIVLASPGLLTTLSASTKAITPTVNLNDLAQLSTVLTTLGDTLAASSNGIPVRIAGNTTTTPKFFTSIGNGTTSALPSYYSILGAGGTTVTVDSSAKTISFNMSAGITWGAITGTLSDQTDLNTALGLKAPLASPTFTGIPAVPTAAPGTNTTQVASTAFVQTALSAATPAWGAITGTLSNQTDLQSALDVKQPLDSDLTAVAALSTTAFGRAFLTETDANSTRSTLGLVIGTNVQAYDADLTTYAGITPSANVQTLLGAANYAAFKTSLSLNAVENTALSTWAGSTNLTTLGTIAAGTWNGSVIGSAYGGAGTVNGIMKANGGGTVSAAVSGTDYEAPLTFSTGLTRSTNTITVNTSQNIATLSNLTSNGLVTTSGGAGTLGVTVPGTGVLTALGVNTGSAGAFVVNGGALGTPASGTVTNLTGTASININGTVGATTPATGAFTTVTASSTLDATGAATFGNTLALTSTTAANNKITQGAAINIGTTSTDGVVLQNTTAAAAGAQQYSPRLRFSGCGWKTNATAGSQCVDWTMEAQPVQGTANPSVNLSIASQVNGGGYTTRATLTSGGQLLLAAAGSASSVAYALNNAVNSGLYFDSGWGPSVSHGGTAVFATNSSYGVLLSSSLCLNWTPDALASLPDIRVCRNGAGNLRFGAADAASPVAQTQSVQNVVAGTTNTAGATRTQIASLGTSQGAPGRYHIQTGGMIAASGTTQQTAVDRAIFGATKVLTNNSATTVANVTAAANTSAAGVLDYTVEVFDGTELQYETGSVAFGLTNKGGAFSGNTATKFGNHQNATSGTLTVTWAISAANPGVLSVNANSSLTPATGYPRVTYNVRSGSQQSISIQ